MSHQCVSIYNRIEVCFLGFEQKAEQLLRIHLNPNFQKYFLVGDHFGHAEQAIRGSVQNLIRLPLHCLDRE